jgi:hypothetical protein
MVRIIVTKPANTVRLSACYDLLKSVSFPDALYLRAILKSDCTKNQKQKVNVFTLRGLNSEKVVSEKAR